MIAIVTVHLTSVCFVYTVMNVSEEAIVITQTQESDDDNSPDIDTTTQRRAIVDRKWWLNQKDTNRAGGVNKNNQSTVPVPSNDGPIVVREHRRKRQKTIQPLTPRQKKAGEWTMQLLQLS